MTASDNAIFNPFTKEWVGENKGIAPDTEQKITAAAVAAGRDLQPERGRSIGAIGERALAECGTTGVFDTGEETVDYN